MKSPEGGPPEFPNFSVKDLMERGTLLLASSGKEFVKPAAIWANASEVKKARQDAMGRLGLDFLDGLGDDMKEIVEELDQDEEMDVDNDVKVEEDVKEDMIEDTKEDMKSPQTTSSPPARSKSSTPAPPATVSASTPAPTSNDEDLSGLSARERNRLKRKRKVGNTAFVSAPPPPAQSSNSKFTAQQVGQSNK